MAHDVFISYAQHDKATADAVCHGLESAGIRCWIAPRDVPAGSNWKTQLVEAIRQARLMVLVFSSEADRSPQVMREVDIAFESGVPIVPFRIEDVKMSDEMYYCIAARHWLDALNPPLEEHIARLTAGAQAILAARPTGNDTAMAAGAPTGAPGGRGREPAPCRSCRSAALPPVRLDRRSAGPPRQLHRPRLQTWRLRFRWVPFRWRAPEPGQAGRAPRLSGSGPWGSRPSRSRSSWPRPSRFAIGSVPKTQGSSSHRRRIHRARQQTEDPVTPPGDAATA